ncbi:MAG: hypothetical protein CVU38_18245 [Chloroflexi bacterium HGW-Chloroflexi-1]|nr:MAG: hypothetical protein CVU38_18245 [Chloroflexi bacterium HGW-Chloroflexi-1]
MQHDAAYCVLRIAYCVLRFASCPLPFALCHLPPAPCPRRSCTIRHSPFILIRWYNSAWILSV